MKNNAMYIPVDALKNRQDFDIWYRDGDLAFSFKSNWESEKDKITIWNRHGAECGHIKLDPGSKTMYYVMMERWEYELHTYIIFEEYFFKGMLWEIKGSPSKPPFDFYSLRSEKNEVHVSRTKFKGHGECLEVRVRDVTFLRIAAAAVVAMMVKEEYKGMSEGIETPGLARMEKVKRWFKGKKRLTYEDIQAGERYV